MQQGADDKLDPQDDWPTIAFHQALASGSELLRRWVGDSPRRALSPDGMTLFVARRHGVYRGNNGSITVWSHPPDDPDQSLFVVDVFHATADATGYFQSQQLAPDVEVVRLECADGALRAVLQLTEAQRAALELADRTVDVAWPTSADGGLAREYHPAASTTAGYLVHLAELLALGGRPTGTLARAAAAQRQELDTREVQRAAAHRAMRGRMTEALAKNWRVAELGLPQMRALDHAVSQAGLGPHRELLRRLARPCWALVPGAGERASRLGGVPDLALGSAWPTRDGELLHFIAQVNLADLPASTGLQLPRQGMLSLFTGMLEPANDVEHQVLYTPGGIDTCPTPPPRGPYRDDQLHIDGSLSLFAEAAVVLPDYGSDAYHYSVGNTLDAEELGRYFALQQALAGPAQESTSRLLGYPAVAGSQPEATAYFQTAGRPDSRFWLRAELDTDDKRAHFDHLHGQLDEVVKGMLDWIPLFRLPSYPQLGLTFWDAGTLNVMIHREALSALRFEQTVATIAT
ncbi:MAG: YwqG family protein [Kofleriaceae bacterium]